MREGRCTCVYAAEIILFDDHVVVFKTLGDLNFYVTGDQDENELVLANVLYAFYEAVNLLLRSLFLTLFIPFVYFFTQRRGGEENGVREPRSGLADIG